MILSSLQVDAPPRLGPVRATPAEDGGFAALMMAQMIAAAVPPPPVPAGGDDGAVAVPADPAPQAEGSVPSDQGAPDPQGVALLDADGAAYLLAGTGLQPAAQPAPEPQVVVDAVEVAIALHPAAPAVIAAPPAAEPLGDPAQPPPAGDDPPPPETPAASAAPQGDRIELTLAPPELGPLHLTLEPGGEYIRVHVAAESAETLALALGSAGELTRLLVAAGYRDTQISFGRAKPAADGSPAPPQPARHEDPAPPPRGLRRRGLDLKI